MTRDKFYVVMAQSVADYEQSDRLFVYKRPDGRLVGYSGQFDSCTLDIAAAVTDDYSSAQWMSSADFASWVPATLEEIRAQDLGRYLLGFKRDTKARGPLEPVEGSPS